MVRAQSGILLAVAAAIFALDPLPAKLARPQAAMPASPAVLELYQSQGCSSCPPALEVLRQEADRPDVIALNFAVTYWDQLGWKDSFAQPAFTSRQWDYAHANRRAQVATPQLIVNGRAFVNGGSKPEVDAAIQQNRIPRSGPALQFKRGELTIGPGPTRRPSTVWLISYDPRTLQVPIRAGENGGRTLAHRNVVRSIQNLGSWSGVERSFSIPQSRTGFSRVVLVQAGPGGPIIAARRIG